MTARRARAREPDNSCALGINSICRTDVVSRYESKSSCDPVEPTNRLRRAAGITDNNCAVRIYRACGTKSILWQQEWQSGHGAVLPKEGFEVTWHAPSRIAD